MVYQITGQFPGSERYGLVSQMRRAAVSICANIAESRGRYELRDQVRFLRIAQDRLASWSASLCSPPILTFLDQAQFAGSEPTSCSGC